MRGKNSRQDEFLNKSPGALKETGCCMEDPSEKSESREREAMTHSEQTNLENARIRNIRETGGTFTK